MAATKYPLFVSLDRNTRLSVALGIFVVALLIRCLGIGWGLKNDLHNQSYHPDEPVIFAYSQSVEPTKLQFTPGFYNYGTLYLTVLRVATDISSGYGGTPNLQTDDGFWQWVSQAALAGRIVSAIAGSVTAVLMFFLAYRFLGAVGGVVSCLVIVVSPAHIMHSRFQTVDIFALALLAGSALCAAKLLPAFDAPPPDEDAPPPNVTKWIIWSGVLAGLSAGTKYTGILGILTLFVAIAYATRNRRQAILQGLIGLVACVAAFVVATPGAVLDREPFLRDFTYEMQHTATGHGLVFTNTSPGFIYHIGNLFLGIGILLTILGIAGLIWAVVKRHPWAVALFVFFIAYYVLIGRAEVKFLRYTFPLYIGIAAGFGFLVAEAQKGKWARPAIGLAILAIGGVDMGGLVAASRVTTWMASRDPRDQAMVWIKSQPDADTAGFVADPWYWSVPLFRDATLPRMPMGPGYLAKIRELGNPFLARMAIMDQASNPTPQFAFDPGPPPNYPSFNMKLLDELKPTYLPMTTFEAGYLERLVGAKGLDAGTQAQVDAYDLFMKKVQEDYQPVAQFGQPVPLIEDFHYVQPGVLVWKRKSPTP